MNKTIIGIYGSGSEGKSTTIKNVARILLEQYPNATSSISPVDYAGDVNIVIHLGNVKIGIESQGDPNSRMIYDKTVEKLAKDGQCDIILCASRTEGETVKTIDKVAGSYDYHTIWISSFWSPTIKPRILNQLAAENIIRIIESLIVGRL